MQFAGCTYDKHFNTACWTKASCTARRGTLHGREGHAFCMVQKAQVLSRGDYDGALVVDISDRGHVPQFQSVHAHLIDLELVEHLYGIKGRSSYTT